MVIAGCKQLPAARGTRFTDVELGTCQRRVGSGAGAERGGGAAAGRGRGGAGGDTTAHAPASPTRAPVGEPATFTHWHNTQLRLPFPTSSPHSGDDAPPHGAASGSASTSASASASAGATSTTSSPASQQQVDADRARDAADAVAYTAYYAPVVGLLPLLPLPVPVPPVAVAPQRLWHRPSRWCPPPRGRPWCCAVSATRPWRWPAMVTSC